MGNIVSDQNNQLINSQLKNIIENWALNNYDAGLSYGQNYEIKNLIKKRACCTRQTNMKIGLPDIDISNPNNIKINDGYIPININVFNNITDPTNSSQWDNNCYLTDETELINGAVNYYQPPINKESATIANDYCTFLYTNSNTSVGTNLNLCGSIRAERDLNYGNNTPQGSYGYYANSQQVNDTSNTQQFRTLETLNNYTDCNCLNSILRFLPNINIQQMEQLVQSNDTYCSSCASEGICYIESDQKDQFLCINYLSVGQSVAENNSNIVFNQNCGEIQPKPPTINHTIEYIILGSVFIVAVLAGLIASKIIVL
jgi:hypothetical protein